MLLLCLSFVDVMSWAWAMACNLLGQERCRTKSPQSFKFSNFRPGVCSEQCSGFSLNFSRTFRALFPGNGNHKCFPKNPAIFKAKFKETFYKSSMESRQRNHLACCCCTKHSATVPRPAEIQCGIIQWTKLENVATLRVAFILGCR